MARCALLLLCSLVALTLWQTATAKKDLQCREDVYLVDESQTGIAIWNTNWEPPSGVVCEPSALQGGAFPLGVTRVICQSYNSNNGDKKTCYFDIHVIQAYGMLP